MAEYHYVRKSLTWEGKRYPNDYLLCVTDESLEVAIR